MNSRQIAQLRLIHQHLVRPAGQSSAELVRGMGCIQAQDYGMAKWAIGCRLRHATDSSIEKDFMEEKVLRTHVLRPTWHFVHPDDIRWMLHLSAEKIRNFARPYRKQLDIDAAVLKKSKKHFILALEKEGPLTRPQLTAILRDANIDTSEARIGLEGIKHQLQAHTLDRRWP